MNNWQNWAVALILLLCIVRIGQSIYSFFRGVKEKRNPCANCATGCELKNLYEKKRSECSEERKETNRFEWLSAASAVCWAWCASARRRKHLPYFACGDDSGGVGGLRPF